MLPLWHCVQRYGQWEDLGESVRSASIASSIAPDHASDGLAIRVPTNSRAVLDEDIGVTSFAAKPSRGAPSRASLARLDAMLQWVT